MRTLFVRVLVAGVIAIVCWCGSAVAKATPATPDVSRRPGVAAGTVQVALDVTGGATSSGFVLTLSVRQPVVPMGSRIVLDMAVTNVSDQALLFDESSAVGEFDLEIGDPAGSIRVKERSRDFTRPPRLRILEPGETLMRPDYTLTKQEFATSGEYRFIARHRFPRLDGGGLILVPSNPVTVRIVDLPQAGQEPTPEGKAASVKMAELRVKTGLIEARNVLQRDGFRVSRTSEGRDIVIARDSETAVTVRPGSSTVFFGKRAVGMGRKADVRGDKVLIPGHIISLIRVYGGYLPF